jgi:hypothetical protein
VPLVATNEAFFPAPDDFEAHDALMAVACNAVMSDDRRPRLSVDNCLKSRAEMTALFADIPEALANTPSRSRSAAPRSSSPRADPAALHRRRRQRIRKQPWRPKRRNCGASRIEGLERRLERIGLADGYTADDYRERLEDRTRHHRAHEISRLLPDRGRLHQMGQGSGHSGGAGPWFGCRFAGGLCAHHHRCRSAALFTAVRALSQSRPRVDA